MSTARTRSAGSGQSQDRGATLMSPCWGSTSRWSTVLSSNLRSGKRSCAGFRAPQAPNVYQLRSDRTARLEAKGTEDRVDAVPVEHLTCDQHREAPAADADGRFDLAEVLAVAGAVEQRLGRLAGQDAGLQLDDGRLGRLRAHRQDERGVWPDRRVGGELRAELLVVFGDAQAHQVALGLG